MPNYDYQYNNYCTVHCTVCQQLCTEQQHIIHTKKISSFEPLTNGLKFSILVKILQSYSNFSESPRVITPRGVNLPGVSYCAESISPGNHTAHRVNLPGYYTVQSQSPQGIMLRIEHRLTIPRSAIYFVFTIELNLLLPCFGLSALYLRIY